MAETTPTVVCGIDDSPGGRAALEEAVRLAGRRGARVRALMVFDSPETWAAWGYGPASGISLPRLEEYRGSEERVARGIVEPVLGRLRTQVTLMPEVEVAAVPGRPTEVLVAAAEQAEALVVGHRGVGAVGSVMMGSTSLACVLHAPCPVTVVPVPVAA